LWGGSCELGGPAPGDAAASGWRAGSIRGRAAAGPARGGPGAGAGMGAGESGADAAAVGLESAATLRVHFARALGISPAAYRRRFSTATTGRIETERRFI